VRVAHTHFDDVALWEVKSRSKYYFFGGQRVAMRRDNVVYYIAGDHLGTTSLVLGAQGDKVAESRHFPYGGSGGAAARYQRIIVLRGNVGTVTLSWSIWGPDGTTANLAVGSARIALYQILPIRKVSIATPT